METNVKKNIGCGCLTDNCEKKFILKKFHIVNIYVLKFKV